MSPKRPSAKKPAQRRKLPVFWCLLSIAAVMVLGFLFWPRQMSHADSLAEATVNFRSGQLDAAERICRADLDQGYSRDTFFLLIDVLQAQPQKEAELVEVLTTVSDQSKDGPYARMLEATLHFKAGRLSKAEKALRKLLMRQPMHPKANTLLSQLLAKQGRSWEAMPHLMNRLRSVGPSWGDLIILSMPSGGRGMESNEVLEKWHRADPGTATGLIGIARRHMDLGEFREAIELLDTAISNEPNIVEAHARLGRCLLRTGANAERMNQWNAKLPSEAEAHPEIWFVRGDASEIFGDLEAASHCFCKSVSLDPTYQSACFRAGDALRQLDDAAAEVFLQRAAVLEKYRVTIDLVTEEPRNYEYYQRLTQYTEQLGNYWDAMGWATLATQAAPSLRWPNALMKRISETLKPTATRTNPDINPGLAFDYQTHPFSGIWQEQAIDSKGSKDDLNTIRLTDVAKTTGVDFTYENGHDPSFAVMKMQESYGGGVGVIDYDLDSWPDLYLAEGGQHLSPDPTLHDRLFHATGEGRFLEVSNAAGLSELEYSQGVSIGDVNSDGFPDVLVGNIGANQLWINRGDGTFTEAACRPRIGRDDWTTSCMIADLNGDTLPDLYFVNYLAGNVLTQICEHKGIVRSCKPRLFPAAQDRVYFNAGDGTFNDVTETGGFVHPDGRSLGIVAADFDGSGEISVFVANDGERNFFFRPQASQENTDAMDLKFDERALISGIALDRAGMAQACMGVACGDVDGDMRPDIFVTNYFSDSNTLYTQRSPGNFADNTGSAGLVQPSYYLLGFGTQFGDFNSDGWQDVVIANGHENDYTDMGIPFRQRPQVLANSKGKFTEIGASELGSYFEGEYVGRGLATLDFNRDGLLDVAITNLDTPVALLENQTETTNRLISLRLVGTSINRDAIGTAVTVTSGQQKVYQQMMGGCGYLSSNEQQLFFGAGDAKECTMEVTWLGGKKQKFEGVESGKQYLLIEDRQLIQID